MKKSRAIKPIAILLFFFSSINYSCKSPIEDHNVKEPISMMAPPAINKSSPSLSHSKVKYNPRPPVEYEENSVDSKFGQGTTGNKSKHKQKKIIKDGNLSVKAIDIVASKKILDELLGSFDAYYESEELQNGDRRIDYELKIRVPSAKFDKLVSSLEYGKDEVMSKRIEVRDVTEEYFDNEARLSTKKEYLLRYMQLLSRAATVQEILSIEENLRVLQEEIESKEGHLRYLDDQVLYSTLFLNLFQLNEYVYTAPPKDKFSERIKKSLNNGWTSILNFILMLIANWPYLIIAIPVLLLIGKALRKKRNQT